jgi:hypothetical protein
VLNIVAILLAADLNYRFIRTGGMPILKMMGGGPESQQEQKSGRNRRGRF